jgi:sugar O-acyltransferase (sialic acid O-acetyltransferase NeuD family)
MSCSIIILGANGNCLDLAEAAEGAGMSVLGFLDDDASLQGKTLGNWRVIGRVADARQWSGEADFVCGIGSPTSYKRKLEIVQTSGLEADRWARVVHSSAVVSSLAELGGGCALLSHASIGARARLGCHVMMLQGSVVSHDSIIGDGCVLATGACVSGGCDIGQSVYLGSRCCVREGICVGAGALIGMGAVVVRDVPAGVVVAGNPARIIR